MRFFGGRIRKKYICQAIFHVNLLVSHIFSRSCVTKHSIVKKKIQVIIPFRIFEKFFPKVQTEALTRQDKLHLCTISVIQGPDFANCERK